jgi:hypothetical protein
MIRKIKNFSNKIEKLLLILYIKTKEKSFGPGQRLKYLLIDNNSDELVIVFSGFPSRKRKASYNMIKTLGNVEVNKLFILDDFGYEKRGAYYLGENGEFFIPPIITELIEKVKKEKGIKKVYCMGSSKGGYASLYYGLKVKADFITVGVPQYLLGNYLSMNEDHLNILRSIMGDTSKDSVNYLNELLRNEIINYNADTKPKMYVHYSKNEHTYGEHIVYLLNDLKEAKFDVEVDVEDYIEHWDVAKYFPQICKNQLIK